MLQTKPTTKLSELLAILSHVPQDKIIFPDEIKVVGESGLNYIPKLKKVMGNWLAEYQGHKDIGYRNIKELDSSVIEVIYNRVDAFVNKKKKAA
jgi:hypothetical protein